MAKYLIALNCHPKIGGQTLKKILATFSDNAEKAWKANELELKKKLDQKIVELIIETRNNYNPDKEIEKLKRLDIGYIAIFDKEYPAQLRELPDAPAILYIKGNYDILKSPSLAVVGSRKFTQYGKNVAYKLAKEVASAGLTVVSGLALGIDAVSHQAALDAGGKTIGVLGCGLDQIYPVANSNLAKQIIDSGSVIITELSPGTPPMKQNFPARNRIIAGLSLGTLVVEAAEESGSLITALSALEYNREVFAVPGSINSETSIGTNRLIQKGAKLVIDASDIFEELNIEVKSNQQKAKDIAPKTEEEEIILNLISREGSFVDNIVRQSGLNIVVVSATLTMMEMKGMVENVGGIYHKKI